MFEGKFNGLVIGYEPINLSLTFLTIDPLEKPLRSLRLPVFKNLSSTVYERMIDFTQMIKSDRLIQIINGTGYLFYNIDNSVSYVKQVQQEYLDSIGLGKIPAESIF